MDAVVELIRQAAATIGVEAVRIWPQVVGITFVQSVVKTIACLVILAVVLVFLERARRWFLACEPTLSKEDKGAGYALSAGSAVLMVVALMVGTSWLMDSVPGIFFPEAQTVLNLVKQVK